MNSVQLTFPAHLLICPASDLNQLKCTHCQTDFFALGDIPCVFTTGQQQKHLWQHQMAMMETQGQEALDNLDYILQGYDLTALTRARLEEARSAMHNSLTMILTQLKHAGLTSQSHPFYQHAEVDNPTEYYHHILRDWAWDDRPSQHYESHVNHTNLKRTLNIWPNKAPKKMLFLGAGAGRLSWDLHQHFNPEFTIASDINPFLLTCAQTLIKDRRPLTLPELYTFPQIGYPFSQFWVMQPPKDPQHQYKNWYALGADVWNMPLKKHSLDTIVTSWLIDVTGGDVKNLIEVISYLLAPGGYWINTGPLLYSAKLSFDLKYSAEEIVEFADMAGFDQIHSSVEEIAHMASPLNARYHHEQIWSFSMQKRVQAKPLPLPGKTPEWLTPPWLIMHHQPIPKIEFKCQMGHDFIKQVIQLVDGKNSIFAIAQTLQPTLPEGVDAKEAIVALFGQILEQMAA
jgi:hypothetical protein